MNKNNARLAVVSGYFDPLHPGHIDYINGAEEFGDVFVIINSDKQAILKKGSSFMDEESRQYIIQHLVAVSNTMISIDGSSNIIESLKMIKATYYDWDITFCNGGDRAPDQDPIPEVEYCERVGIKLMYGVGGYEKQESSQEIVRAANAAT